MTYLGHGLYLGGLKDASNREWLQKEGITAIVNCAYEIPNFFPTSFIYKNLNLNDATDNIAVSKFNKQLIPAALFISHHQKNGKVLIHCAVGRSRSAGILAFYIMNAYNATSDEVINFMKKYRPIVEPNPGFKKILDLYSEKLQHRLRKDPSSIMSI